MALVHCPDCGTQTSEHADACPKCSYPISKLKASNATAQPQHTFTAPLQVNESSDVGLIATGYILAVIALLFIPVLFGLGGIVVGVVTIGKGHTGHGVAHIVLSFVLGFLGFVLGAMFG